MSESPGVQFEELSSANALDRLLERLGRLGVCDHAYGDPCGIDCQVYDQHPTGPNNADCGGSADGERLALLEELERVKSAAAAAQVRVTAVFVARETRRLEAAREEARRERRVLPPRPALSVGAQVGLASHQSQARGQRLAEGAISLVRDLPHTLAALGRGDLDEERAMLIVRETQDLSPRDRQAVDEALTSGDASPDAADCPDCPGDTDGDAHGDAMDDCDATQGADPLRTMGPEALRQAVQRLALRFDADAKARRMQRARAERRVTGRLLGDGTGRVTAVLPREHYATVMASLGQAATQAKTSGDERTRDQLKADILVNRVTGQDTTRPMPVAVNLVISAESLLGHSDEPGFLHGLTCGSKSLRATHGRGAVGGYIPAGLCADLIMQATADSRASLRRLFTAPGDDELVAMDARARLFDWQLATMINLRDGGMCRTPWCDAPIRQTDHALSNAEGGATTLANGQGLCQACNLVKETPGWTTWPGTAPDGGHQVTTVTPHNHVHTTHPPPLPLPLPRPPSRRRGYPGSRHPAGTPAGLRWSSLDRDEGSGPGPAEVQLVRDLAALLG